MQKHENDYNLELTSTSMHKYCIHLFYSNIYMMMILILYIAPLDFLKNSLCLLNDKCGGTVWS